MSSKTTITTHECGEYIIRTPNAFTCDITWTGELTASTLPGADHFAIRLLGEGCVRVLLDMRSWRYVSKAAQPAVAPVPCVE